MRDVHFQGHRVLECVYGGEGEGDGCGYRAYSSFDLRRHVKNAHLCLRGWPCQWTGCGFVGRSHTSLEGHMLEAGHPYVRRGGQ